MVYREKQYNDTLVHYNLNHNPKNGQFTTKMAHGSLISYTDSLVKKIGKRSIKEYLNDDKTKSIVTRWGRSGLEYGDWVMKGDNTILNYILSAKWQPGFGNQFASKDSGKTYVVYNSQLKNPSGFGIDGSIKALFRQKRYRRG